MKVYISGIETQSKNRLWHQKSLMTEGFFFFLPKFILEGLKSKYRVKTAKIAINHSKTLV